VSQLEQIQTRLDWLLTALYALAKIKPEQVLQALQALNLESVITETSLPWSSSRPQLSKEETRGWTLTLTYLARQHQELIRRAVSLLEQMNPEEEPSPRFALLTDYLDNFTNFSHNRPENTYSPMELTQIAWKLLIDLLFYSSPQGDRRLWSVLLASSAEKPIR
jgi:hypothetical protein